MIQEGLLGMERGHEGMIAVLFWHSRGVILKNPAGGQLSCACEGPLQGAIATLYEWSQQLSAWRQALFLR